MGDVTPESIRDFLQYAVDSIVARIWSVDALIQLLAIAGTLIAAWLLSGPTRAVVARFFGEREATRAGKRAASLIESLVLPAIWIALLGGAQVVIEDFGYGVHLARVASSLLGAWIVIRVSTSLISEPYWARVAAVVAWTIAALNILHLLGPIANFLDGIAIEIGESPLSLLSVFKAAILVTVMLWSALGLAKLLQKRIQQLPNVTPSVQVLLSQILKITLIAMAILLGLSSVGIDLTMFHVFSGAVGLGVGFGLQKIVSNLISGIILLLDRSIKPGDVVEVGDTFGTVDSLGARYTSVVTRDGTEWLIPNEDLITQRVANWSYSSKLIRQKIPIGISYDSDLDLATQLILDAAGQQPRVLQEPRPKCFLASFGDSSVDLELRYWIQDPENGVANIKNEILRHVWHGFHENEIQIPYPQRDLHVRSGRLEVQIDSAPRSGD